MKWWQIRKRTADLERELLSDLELEEEEQREGGVSPEEAIVAGTSRSAEALKLSERTGAVEVGRFADLMVVVSDPTAGIEVLSHPSYVFRKGRPILTPQSPGVFRPGHPAGDCAAGTELLCAGRW